MSEEEIVEDAKQYINNIKELLNEGKNDMTEKENTDFYTLQVVIQGLLDLYNKEKEKNERLIDRTIKYDTTLEHLQRDTIRKDKIKDEVEYIRFMVDDDNKPSEIVKEVNLYLDLFLQELLEERN